MTIKNCTPHILNIHLADGSVRDIPPSGDVPRVATDRRSSDEIDGIPVEIVSMGAVEGLPDFEPGTWLVVSSLVASAVGARYDGDDGRMDLLVPGELVRDAAGKPIGCRGLAIPR